MQPQILSSHRSRLAEGPIYHPDEHAVYWTDIEGGFLHRFDCRTSAVDTVHRGSPIGGITIQQDGSLLLFRAEGAIERFSDGQIQVLHASIPGEETTRFNDVAADPVGRVFCGTMPTNERKGRLYRLDLDGSLSIVLEGLGCPNGMGWSPDLKTMYFTDSSEKTIYKFDFDPDLGTMANQSEFFVLGSEGVPDGMTVDAEGNVWTGIWDGGCLLKLSPEGAILERVELPARKITCPAFGGKDLNELYVTAAGGHLPADGPAAGELLLLKPDVKGKAEFRSRIVPADG